MMIQTININFLTKEELAEYRAANLVIATLESKITYREIQQWKKEQKKDEKVEQKEGPRFKVKDLQFGVEAYKLFKEVGLCESYSEAKRLIRQGGLYLNGKKVKDPYGMLKAEDAIGGVLKLQRGKKRVVTINVKSTNINI